MPPIAQEGFERFDHVIGCGHVSGLQVRPDMAAGRYGDTRTWRKSLERALSSLALVAFPGPDLTDHLTLPFVALLTRPTFPKPRRLMLAQIAATVGTRKSSPFASMAQTERAILLASAMATSIFGGSYWVPGWWEEVWVACLQGLYDSRRGRRELATLREDPPIWWYRIWSTSRH